MIISIDHGNRNVKTGHGICFNSGYTKSATVPPMAKDVVFYNNNYYALSQNTFPFVLDKTKNENFFILTLFAIAKELRFVNKDEGNYKISLSIGLPPMHYGALKDKFENYFYNHFKDGVNFTYNNNSYNIIVEKVYVFPQAYAAALSNEKASFVYDYPKCYILDIGGYTADLLELQEQMPNLDKCRSMEFGVLKMYEIIKDKVLQDTTYIIDNTVIEAVLSNKKHALNEDTVNIIKEQAAIYTDNIFNQIRQFGIDLRTTPVIFIGGGSILLREYIDKSDKIGLHEYIDDICANAVGYFIFACDMAG